MQVTSEMIAVPNRLRGKTQIVPSHPSGVRRCPPGSIKYPLDDRAAIVKVVEWLGIDPHIAKNSLAQNTALVDD